MRSGAIETNYEDIEWNPKLIIHHTPSLFLSPQAKLIAQSIGQSFSVAYQEFLRANGIDPDDLSQREYSDLLNTQDMYNEDLIHFSKSENCRDVSVAAGGSKVQPNDFNTDFEFWIRRHSLDQWLDQGHIETHKHSHNCRQFRVSSSIHVLGE